MADKVNLKKSYSALNEKLSKTFDENGVRRSFTVPYIDGQDMSTHIASVSQAASQSGGLSNSLITTMHHSNGKGWGSGDGQTIGHPSDALRNTIIPKNDPHAKETIAAAQKHLDNISSLLGDDDPSVKAAKGQLALVKKTDGAGMNLLDFGVLLTQIMYAPTQAVARAHQGTKPGGHSPRLSGPAAPQESQAPDNDQDAQGSTQPEAPAAPATPGGAAPTPEASASAPAATAAPAAQQAQG